MSDGGSADKKLTIAEKREEKRRKLAKQTETQTPATHGNAVPGTSLALGKGSGARTVAGAGAAACKKPTALGKANAVPVTSAATGQKSLNSCRKNAIISGLAGDSPRCP